MSNEQQYISIEGKQMNARLDIYIIQEDKHLIAYSPALDLSAYGDNYDDAFNSFDYILKCFFKDFKSIKQLKSELILRGWKFSQQNYKREVFASDLIRHFPMTLIEKQARDYRNFEIA